MTEEMPTVKDRIRCLHARPEQIIDYTLKPDAPLKEIAQEALNYLAQGTPVRMSWDGLCQRLYLISSKILGGKLEAKNKKLRMDNKLLSRRVDEAAEYIKDYEELQAELKAKDELLEECLPFVHFTINLEGRILRSLKERS